MTYKEINSAKIHSYSSINEFINFIENTSNNRFFSRYMPSSNSKTVSQNFSGTSSYEEAVKLLQEGWSPEAQKLATSVKLTNTVSSSANSRSPQYSVVGFQPSVPRYLQGIPTNMINMKITPKKQKIIVLTKNIGYNYGTSAGAIHRQGVKALQIVKSLEEVGFRVKLNVVLCTSKYGENLVCKICVKQPDERLALSKIAFPIAHSSMLRRFLLKWIEVHPTCKENFTDGYGKASAPTDGYEKNEYLIPDFVEDVSKFCENLQNQVK